MHGQKPSAKIQHFFIVVKRDCDFSNTLTYNKKQRRKRLFFCALTPMPKLQRFNP
jgi:hypothetical protein